MSSLLSTIRKRSGMKADSNLSFDDWMAYFNFNGLSYGYSELGGTLGGNREEIASNFVGVAQGAYRSNGVVFACMLVRQMLFSEARLQYRQLRKGRPGDLFGTNELGLLERPWKNGTTGDLLSRMIQDADLAGNHFSTVRGTGTNRHIRRMRPDWVTIVMGSPNDPAVTSADLDAELLGYVYHPPTGDPITLLPEEVCHFAPIPDPLASYRGMSWLTPLIREIMSDGAMTTHKLKYFENGAPQPLDAAVLTRSGWSTMGDIEVGDEVIGRDGTAHDVLAVYPQGEQDIYRVTFSDGASTECTQNHLWSVANFRDRQVGRRQTLALGEIVRKGLRYASGPLKWAVPFVEPIDFGEPEDLPLDPYLMGLLLGDGSFCQRPVTLTVGNENVPETRELVTAAVPDGVGWSTWPKSGCEEWLFNGGHRYRPNVIAQALTELDLRGVRGPDKWIPEVYLRASIQDRLSLLQGLIDSDGHCEKQGQVRFTNSSERLCNGLMDLVGSLGGRAACSPNAARGTFTVRITRLPAWMVPCRLERKARRYRRDMGRQVRHRFIEKVEFVGRKQAQCIHLAGDENLYVTDDYIVTHNTPNLVVSLDPAIKREAFEQWIELFEENHTGVMNAYKTLYLGAGADAKIVGNDLKQIDFKVVQGATETRIAAAAGVPPVIVGLSEGLAAATYANYGQARRRLTDGTMRPLWRNAAGSLQTLVPRLTNAELWYDSRDIAFLQEDQKDDAAIKQLQASTIRSLIDAGYKPDSVVAAVSSGDFNLLVHTGLYSVQLQPPGTTFAASGSPNDVASGTNGNAAAALAVARAALQS